ncbi:MAG: DUF4178 domain-containing protein [Mesorhizobium sp.]|uniref:DUF4178 domain-containing protein n=1 Tax=Mesorhizobium sp. TaxID=1871066 RepID=UPI000FD5676A|nr:DUF4178 domain-containing protein [Mesorhizobium sp.]RVD69561.1 DUF4178 domain-containing protein [Mesorhizobium sp. M4A.F.Ca.ET.029.04.2.1]TIW31391.1 MAG: DUF4178 domain-containing protein [Mesorhizobium sp.]
MRKFDCPSCGADVTFRSAQSVYAVCAYCQSMVVRTDVDVKSIGVMAALPDDMSPLQLGSGGYFEQQPFTLIGRLKIGWRDGLWNEWHLLTADGRRGWIGEAQGSFSISFELEGPLPRDVEVTLDHCHGLLTSGKPAAEARPGFAVQLGGTTLRAVDIKLATCLGSEGELPFAAPKGRRTVAIDCIGRQGEFATLDHDGREAHAYVGRYVEWDAFRFTNLRPLEGW